MKHNTQHRYLVGKRNGGEMPPLDLSPAYKWRNTPVYKYAPPMSITFRQVLGWLLVLLAFIGIVAYAMDASAEPMPQTMTVKCADGVVAHDVIGDFHAPCLRHGGPVAIAEGGPATDNDPEFVAIGTGDGEFHVVATCIDGSEYWSNKSAKRDACKGHGGVKEWADGSPVKHKKLAAYTRSAKHEKAGGK